MNKVFCRKRVLFSFILAGYLILFNTACGLDTFYVIDSPNNTIHAPSYSSIEYQDNYFEFWTEDKTYDAIKFQGTEVYYRIYKSSDRLRTEVNDLIAIAEKDESNSAAYKLTDTYKYQPLRGKGYEDKDVLIPTAGYNQRVYIRLSDYSGTYFAEIKVNNNNIYGSSTTVIPVRNLDKSLSFNFKELTEDERPQSGDVDVNTNGSSSDNDWYVSLFAVAVGLDYTYSQIYSNILYLGSVRIPIE